MTAEERAKNEALDDLLERYNEGVITFSEFLDRAHQVIRQAHEREMAYYVNQDIERITAKAFGVTL